MYVKYLINRIQTGPSSLWTRWKSFRNYPGMEYRDVHGIIPGSIMWKFPNQGSIKYKKDMINNADYFKLDFKTPYRDSPYFVRRFAPDYPERTVMYHNLEITKEDINEMSRNHLNWKEDFYDKKEINYYSPTENMSIEDKHEFYGNFFKTYDESEKLVTQSIYI
jgi:hypothetical protein